MGNEIKATVGMSLEDYKQRLFGRAVIALGSDSEYDEFVIVENDRDASALVLICNEVDSVRKQRDALAVALDECTTHFERCCAHSGSNPAKLVDGYRALVKEVRS